MSALALHFKIFRGDRLVREETLRQTVIKIGKVSSAHLRVDDDSVSRMHAILEVDTRGDVHVIDLGSTRGTFINGHKVHKAKLESGDAIQVGELRIEVAFARTDAVIAAPVIVAAPVPPPLPVVAWPPLPVAEVPPVPVVTDMPPEPEPVLLLLEQAASAISSAANGHAARDDFDGSRSRDRCGAAADKRRFIVDLQF